MSVVTSNFLPRCNAFRNIFIVNVWCPRYAVHSVMMVRLLRSYGVLFSSTAAAAAAPAAAAVICLPL